VREVAARTLPRGYDLGWEGLSWDESRSGNASLYIFLIVVVFVYLVLVAQYESFLIPLAVILSLPIGIFGSFLFLQAAGLSNDVWAQLGLIMLVGLLGKNAILIVEFAVQRRHEGASLTAAAVEGGMLRFRPIQMTSFAFVAGLIPLIFARGAGALGSRTIGVTGVGGMLWGTIAGVVVIPGLYYLFGRLTDGRKLLRDETDVPLTEPRDDEPPTPDYPSGDGEPPTQPSTAGDQLDEAEPSVVPSPSDDPIGDAEPLVASFPSDDPVGDAEPLVDAPPSDDPIGEAEPLVASAPSDDRIGEAEPLVVSSPSDDPIGDAEPSVPLSLRRPEG
jgi:HAE1 family hydrophobic/amphiphilic exporter-1